MLYVNRGARLVLRTSLALIALTATVAAAEWQSIDDGLWTFDGTLNVEKESIALYAVQFEERFYDLKLIGARMDGGVPTIGDLKALEKDPTIFSLASVVNRHPKGRIFIPTGYPEDEELPVIEGLTRINGKEYSDRDTYRAFKSALICVHERGIGSRINEPPTTVVFNAFERGLPVEEINPRVENPANCEDVIQTGPRIVEYRAKPGITRTETRTKKQNWIVLAIGNGPSFNHYFIFTKSKTNLYFVQQMLLKAGMFSQNDRRARVAVNLTSGIQAGIAVRSGADSNPVFVGNSSHPHPTYFMVLKK